MTRTVLEGAAIVALVVSGWLLEQQRSEAAGLRVDLELTQKKYAADSQLFIWRLEARDESLKVLAHAGDSLRRALRVSREGSRAAIATLRVLAARLPAGEEVRADSAVTVLEGAGASCDAMVANCEERARQERAGRLAAQEQLAKADALRVKTEKERRRAEGRAGRAEKVGLSLAALLLILQIVK